MLAEVELGTRFETVNTMAEINLIGIKSENLFFGKAALDLYREQDFVELAAIRAIGRQEKVARQLHCQRGCALDIIVGQQVAIGSAQNTPERNAPVLLKVSIFNGDNSIAQNLWIIVVLSNGATLKCE